MPQSFSWSITFPAAPTAPVTSVATGGAASSAPVVGGPPPLYAVVRQLNPGTGDVMLAGRTWTRGSPMAEVVVRTLRTPKGSYLPDPTFGIDLRGIRHGTPNAGAAYKAAIENALKPYVDQKRMTGLKVSVTVAGSAVLYDVQFADPKATTPQRVVGTL